jgi:hypothetical protein
MRVLRYVFVLAAAALLSFPITAAIKAMTLRELMSITTDAIQGKVVARESLHLDAPEPGSIWTQLTIEGESLRTGEKKTYEVIFHGSHESEDWYGVSTMPTLQDSRVGAETLIFFGEHPRLPGKNIVFNYAGLYRVEQGFGEKVVIGKGEGAAFAENAKLSAARVRVLATHTELVLEPKAPGLSK